MKAEPILIVDDEREIADLLEVYLKISYDEVAKRNSCIVRSEKSGFFISRCGQSAPLSNLIFVSELWSD